MGLQKLLIDSGDEFRQRSLGYGENKPLMTKDLPGVGDSGTFQSIDAVSTFNTLTDGLIPGGGALAVERAATDTARISKFLVTKEGISFLAKEVAGQRMNPQSLISSTNRTRTPISLLAQIPVNIAGFHLRRDGLNPFGGKKYENQFNDIIKEGNEGTINTETIIDSVTANIIDGDPDTFSLIEKSREVPISPKNPKTLLTLYNKIGLDPDENILKEYSGGPDSTFGIGNTTIRRYENTNKLAQNPFGPTQLKPVYNKPEVKERIKAFGLGNPGERKIKESDGSYVVNVNKTKDQINAADIYFREELNEENAPEVKDFIRFKIAMVDTSNPLNDEVLLFRAFLEGIQDNFTGTWNPHKYNGRAENFYTYDGFDRQISFNFKISAQTMIELKPLYTKLNYLVGSTAPVYNNRRMRGRYVRLTIGNWFNEMPGFFKNISLNWETNFPWELNIDGPEYPDAKDVLSQHPHILNVQCAFQPIHDFTPEHTVDTPFIIPKGFNYVETKKPADAPPPIKSIEPQGIRGGSELVSADNIGIQQPAQIDVPKPERQNIQFVRYFSRGSGDLRKGKFETIDSLGTTRASEGLGGRIDFGTVDYVPELVDDENPTNVVNLLSGLEAVTKVESEADFVARHLQRIDINENTANNTNPFQFMR